MSEPRPSWLHETIRLMEKAALDKMTQAARDREAAFDLVMEAQRSSTSDAAAVKAATDSYNRTKGIAAAVCDVYAAVRDVRGSRDAEHEREVAALALKAEAARSLSGKLDTPIDNGGYFEPSDPSRAYDRVPAGGDA